MINKETESLTQTYQNEPEIVSRLKPTSEILSSTNSLIQNDSSSHPTAAKLQKKSDRQFGNQYFGERRQMAFAQSPMISEPCVRLPSQTQVQQHLQMAAPPPPAPVPPAPRQVQMLTPPVQVAKPEPVENPRTQEKQIFVVTPPPPAPVPPAPRQVQMLTPPVQVAKPNPVEKLQPQEKRIFVVADHQRCVMSNLSFLWENKKLCDAGIGNGMSTVMADQSRVMLTDPAGFQKNQIKRKLASNQSIVSTATRHAESQQKNILVVANHQRSVMSNLATLWKNRKLCDAGIGNGKSTLKVHKVVLSAVCPKLLSVFSTDVLSQKFLQVNFPEEVSEEALNAFAEYMYNGILDLDPDILRQLKIIAKRLDMKELKQLCDKYFPSNLSQQVDTSTTVPILPMTSSTTPATTPKQSVQLLPTQVIEVKQEILEDELLQVPKDTAALFSRKSEVVSLAPIKSENSDGVVIYPSIKTEPVVPEDDRYGQVNNSSNNSVFSPTTSSSSLLATAAAASSSTSISSIPASPTEFTIPFSQSTDNKSTKLKSIHPYESPVVSDLSPVSSLVETVCSQSNVIKEDSSQPSNKGHCISTPPSETPSTSSCLQSNAMKENSSKPLNRGQSISTSPIEEIYPVELYTAGGDNLLLLTEMLDCKNTDLSKIDLT